MKDSRMPKQLFYGELVKGERPPYKPRKRYKDLLKASLKEANISPDTWEGIAMDRGSWRRMVHEGTIAFEKSRIAHKKVRRDIRRGIAVALPDDKVLPIMFTCNVCARPCLSRAGLKSHLRSHKARPKIDYKVTGTTHHTNIRQGHEEQLQLQPTIADKGFSCQLCTRQCRSLAGLKSHIRSKHC